MNTAKTWGFSANLSYLWTELPFLERFAAAAAAGFEAVEFHFPYAFDAHEIAAAARDAGVRVVMFNCRRRLGAGERVSRPADRVAEFPRRWGIAHRYAGRWTSPRLKRAGGIARWARRRLAARYHVGNLCTLPSGPRPTGSPSSWSRSTPGTRRASSSAAPPRRARSSMPRGARTCSSSTTSTTPGMEGDMARQLPRPAAHRTSSWRQSGPSRAGHRRDQFPLPVRATRALGYGGWVGCEYKPSTSPRGQPGLDAGAVGGKRSAFQPLGVIRRCGSLARGVVDSGAARLIHPASGATSRGGHPK